MNAFHAHDKKSLKIRYIFHFIIYALIIAFNFVVMTKMLWLNKALYYIYLFHTFFGIIYFLFPILPLIYLLSEKFTIKNIKKFKTITLVFCVIAIVLGVVVSYILMMVILDLPDFYKECPFNIPTSNINEQQCQNKRCILNIQILENEYPYEYLCNYDSTQDFQGEGPFERKLNETNVIISEYQVLCQKYDGNFIFDKEIIYKYLDICSSNEYYICQRFNEPDKFSVKENFVCPNDNYIKNIIIMSIVNIIFNLILGFIPWRIEIIVYNRVIAPLNMNNDRKNISLNSTNNCSKVIKNKEESSFKKTPTEIIIVCTKEDLNKNEENNNNIKQNITINNINVFINKNINNFNNNEENIKPINNNSENKNYENDYNNKSEVIDIKKKENKKNKERALNLNSIKLSLNLRNQLNNNDNNNNEEYKESFPQITTERMTLDEQNNENS